MLLLIADKAFSYDSTKLHIRLKIMDPTMLPVSPNAVTTYNSSFNTWMAQHHVTDLVKVFSDEYDNVGELKYKYKMFHRLLLLDCIKVFQYDNLLTPNFLQS